ncbi:hypothetical protein S83_004606, partial [Arachis hypogaea]
VVARLSEVALSSKLAGERGVSVVRLEVALSNELGGKRGLSDEVLWQAWGVETWLISLPFRRHSHRVAPFVTIVAEPSPPLSSRVCPLHRHRRSALSATQTNKLYQLLSNNPVAFYLLVAWIFWDKDDKVDELLTSPTPKASAKALPLMSKLGLKRINPEQSVDFDTNPITLGSSPILKRAGLTEDNPSIDFLEGYIEVVLLRNIENLYACGVNESDVQKTLIDVVPRILSWILRFTNKE